MELLAFIFLLLFFVFLALMSAYYIQLLKSKEEYTKEEIVSFKNILPSMLRQLLGKDTMSSVLAMLGVFILGWLYNLIGGIFNAHNSASYVFHSALLISVLYFTYKPLLNTFSGSGEDSFFVKILKKEQAVFFALGISQVALNFASWGAHSSNPDTVSFWWVFPNALVNFVLAVMPLANRESNIEADEVSFSEDEVLNSEPQPVVSESPDIVENEEIEPPPVPEDDELKV